jgi:hypothetical protein
MSNPTQYSGTWRGFGEFRVETVDFSIRTNRMGRCLNINGTVFEQRNWTRVWHFVRGIVEQCWTSEFARAGGVGDDR